MEWLDTLLGSGYAWLAINSVATVFLYLSRISILFLVFDATERILVFHDYWEVVPDWKCKLCNAWTYLLVLVFISWIVLAFSWVFSYAIQV